MSGLRISSRALNFTQQPYRKMFRFPRPKLVAEFAIFLLIATAVIQIALHFTSSAYTFYHLQGPKTPAVASASPRTQANQKSFGIKAKNESVAKVTFTTKTHLVPKAEPNGPTSKPVTKVSNSSPNVNTKGDQLLSNNDLLKNISKPYYTIVSDDDFKIDRSYFYLRSTRISTIPDKFPISSSNICHPDSPSILFIIPSVATAHAAVERLEIRKTWASHLYGPTWTQTSPVRLAFFFGSSGLSAQQLEFLKEESERYGDIVVGEFLDSYHNLSLKMAVTISWVAQNCPNVKAAIKIDMDTYVNVNLLVTLIDQLPVGTHPNYVFGHRHGAQRPLVVRTGAWAVPESLYPFDRFPRYIYGHSYVISGPAVKLMADGFPWFPVVPNEDAFATGIMTVTLNITRFHHDSFAYLLEPRTLCDMTNGVHATAVMKGENRIKLWNAFKTGTCIKEKL
ncbi:beta-1,3-galactosyltransferase 1-like [Elysia marginata]|uniref:Hexosyltransferase n=1 Tax=Elysia marginata TaxID=1093978 RepID=A0AAV4IUN2_9GAST|nr:beta-1,3-galactosyltransferase 1-like [Elysia marginata]